MDVQTKFQTTRSELGASLIERHEEIDLMLAALLAGEHCLLVGPPGTAKSTLADSLVSWIAGNKFSIPMNRRPVRMHAIPVDPDPMNGSRIVLPSFAISTSRAISVTGFCVV